MTGYHKLVDRLAPSSLHRHVEFGDYQAPMRVTWHGKLAISVTEGAGRAKR